MRVAILLYGIVCYVLFLVAFLYAMGFEANAFVPKGIDDGEPGPVVPSIIINVLLLSVFAVQHTIMARPAFKKWWTKIIPVAAERSTFVLAASLALILMYWQWRPMPEVVWDVSGNTAAAIVIWGVSLLGWGIVLYASFLIDHFDLFGLRQTYFYFAGKEYHHPPFAQPWLYRIVRNPLMLGFLIAFWATPTMTQGHLLFSMVVTGYIFFGIFVEERDIMKALGDDYIAYRERTSMIIPFLKFRKPRSIDPGATKNPT